MENQREKCDFCLKKIGKFDFILTVFQIFLKAILLILWHFSIIFGHFQKYAQININTSANV